MARFRLPSWSALVPLAALLVLLAPPLAARDVGGLYNGAVKVADRSQGELARGTAAALAEVLIKLTGNRRLPGDAAARPVLAKAGKLVLQYGYANAPKGGLQLNVEFDQQALNGELAERGIALWGKARPDTVAWIVVEDADGRRLLSNDEPGLLGQALLKHAGDRALPVLLPLQDIEEARTLTTAESWDDVATAALQLADRYGTPAVLVGQLKQNSPQVWEARWKLKVGEDLLEWNQDGDTGEGLAEEGVDALGDALARRYADPALMTGADSLTLSVVGVRTAEDYARLSTYLDTLDTVTRLFLRSVDNERVLVEVTARGGRAGLAQSIGFGRVLVPVTGQVDVYQLQP